MNEDQIHRVAAEGDFSVTWEAHGLYYGILKSVLEHVESGGVTIANGSRIALQKTGHVYAKLIVINLIVEKKILTTRFLARGRENAQQIALRLARAEEDSCAVFDAFHVDNSGQIEHAGNTILQLPQSHLDTNLQGRATHDKN